MSRPNKGGRADLLVEIGTEELPPRALQRLAEAFAELLTVALTDQSLAPAGAAAWFATPRRLAARLPAVARRCPDRVKQRRGPALAAAFDGGGAATPAAVGFARSCGVPIDVLEKLETDKGSWLVHRTVEAGDSASALVPQCIEQAIIALPTPKRMRWGKGSVEFVRPVHWLVVLHGSRVIPCQLLGVAAGRVSAGHRFMGEHRVRICSAGSYEQDLEECGAVIADFARRRQLIARQVQKLGNKAGGVVVADPALLDTVTALVEKPHALLGHFDPAFLEVPPEALISSMRDHQKYFHVVDDKGVLLPRFITVSNIRSTTPGRVSKGNERVLQARLADAQFFWKTDCRQPLDSRIDALEGVLFHQALGSLRDKARRLSRLARQIAQCLGADPAACVRAAELCKADLVTGMVGEFPDLQGVMGRHLAKHDQEPVAVARAIEEHYLPRQAGDALPSSTPGRIVALADRLDSLVGIFSTGEEPTGEKDPYALRRAALGIIRILVEKKLDLDIVELVDSAADAYTVGGHPISGAVREQAVAFIMERYRAWYSSAGFSNDEISAVLEAGASRPLDFDRRLKAVSAFRRHRDAASLAAANKRIRNILRQATDAIPRKIDSGLLTEPAEIALAEALIKSAGAVTPLIGRGDYKEALRTLAGLRSVVDRFFDEVMVMTDDTAVRGNRLALLSQLGGMFLAIADISLLQQG